MTPQNAVVFTPDLLRVYYDRLYPFDMMHEWLSYGNEWGRGNEPGNEKGERGRERERYNERQRRGFKRE